MINIIMCGSAGSRPTPYKIFYMQGLEVRRNIIEELHHGKTIDQIAKTLSISSQQLMNHIQAMEKTGYVKLHEDRYFPNFLVALADEVETVKDIAYSWGTHLTAAIQKQKNWQIIEDTYKRLSVSERFPFRRIGLPLVGDFLLDIGMLGIFYQDATIMPHPSDEYGGNFYVWGIEGAMDALGRYGSHSEKFNDVMVFSFGGEKVRKRVTLPDAYWENDDNNWKG